MRISPLQIYQAKKRIAPWVTRTPLVRAHDLSELCGAEIWSKLEIMQPTGAFKLRGATNTILQLNEDERKRGEWWLLPLEITDVQSLMQHANRTFGQ